MRISLRNLLLIFPAFFISVFLAPFLELPVCILYRWQMTLMGAQRLQQHLDWELSVHCDEELWMEAINNSLAGKPVHDDRFKWVYYGDPPEFDSWRNPYRCVYLGNENGRNKLGVYSTGADGVSTSHGNDPDDLNSWDPKSGLLYRRQIDHARRLRYAVEGALLTPFTYAGILAIGWRFRRGGTRK